MTKELYDAQIKLIQAQLDLDILQNPIRLAQAQKQAEDLPAQFKKRAEEGKKRIEEIKQLISKLPQK